MGRRRSARNALRHGLTLPVLSDPTLAEEVVALAQQIAGEDIAPKLQESACQIAEAQADLRRIRSLRHDLVARALSDSNYDSQMNLNKKLTIALRVARRWGRGENVPEGEANLLLATLQEPDRFATVISEIAAQLPALERYERRALSRRKRAIRAFDAAKEASRSSPPLQTDKSDE